jgi:hypothetical protein
MNRVFHEYIRAFISQTHRDWDVHLYTAMFALNNSVSESIGCTPAFLTYGFHPRSPHSQAIETLLAGERVGRSDAAFQFVDIMNSNFKIAKNCLAKAQSKMSAARAGKNKELTLKKDDLVLLKTTNLTMPGKRKFLPRFVGPFVVSRPIGVNAYELVLPDDWRIHNVFNVSLLRQYVARPGFVLYPARAPQDDYSYVPESIEDHRLVVKDPPTSKPLYSYKVHYENTSPEEDTWEYMGALSEFYFDLLQNYHVRHDLYPLLKPAPVLPEPVPVTASIRRARRGRQTLHYGS